MHLILSWSRIAREHVSGYCIDIAYNKKTCRKKTWKEGKTDGRKSSKVGDRGKEGRRVGRETDKGERGERGRRGRGEI